MKKVILFFSVLFLSTTLTFGQTATLSVPDLDVQPAGSVFFPITIDMLSADDWGTFQFYFTYDPAVLTPVGDWGNIPGATGITYPSPNFPFYEWANNNQYGPDEVILTWLSFTGPKYPVAGEVICVLEFTYTGDPDYSDLTWGLIAKNPQAGYPEKGATLLWTFGGIMYTLDLIDGSVGPTTAGYTWNGSIDEHWDNPLNWTPNGIPGPADEVFIPDVAKAPFPTISGPVATGNLTIFPNAMLTVGVFGELTTNGLFTNDGSFYILSDNVGYSGSFIDLGGLAGVGMYSFDRDVLYTKTDEDNWHYCASPVAGFTSDDLLDYYLNTWDAGAQMWVHHAGTSPCTPAATIGLGPLEGWSIRFDEFYACPTPGTGQMIEFMGPFAGVNTGPFAAPLLPGWNLLGNPYSSCVDPGLVAFGPNTAQALAYWDGWFDNYVYWSAIFPLNYLPPTNGFFVEATAADNFALTGVERLHDAFATYWWKSDITQLVSLRATSSSNKYDETHIRFMDNMTAAFDMNGDAHKLISTADGLPQIYTTVGEEMLAINGLPATPAVPMGFTSVESGTFTIEAVETTDFENVVLEDLVEGVQTNLLEDSYTFNYTSGEDANRFIVHFTPLGTPEFEANSINIWSADHTIYVNVPGTTNGDIVVFNMMGQEVVRTDIEPGLNTLPMDDVNTYYVVKVLTSNNAVTGKVFIK